MQPQLFETPDEVPAEVTNAKVTNANAATDEKIIAQVHEAARAVPSGRVISYGALGARCNPPISGYICGRIMIHSHESVPWWRVVAKDGALPIHKRNPLLGRTQRDLLEAEGVLFDDQGRVRMAEFAVE